MKRGFEFEMQLCCRKSVKQQAVCPDGRGIPHKRKRINLVAMLVRPHKKRIAQTILLIAMMVLALLMAQTLGMQHRLSHINTVVGDVFTLEADGQDFKLQKLERAGDTSLHSCVLLDASSLSDGVLHVPHLHFSSLLPSTAFVRDIYRGWAAQLRLPFLSRAPPF